MVEDTSLVLHGPDKGYTWDKRGVVPVISLAAILRAGNEACWFVHVLKKTKNNYEKRKRNTAPLLYCYIAIAVNNYCK